MTSLAVLDTPFVSVAEAVHAATLASPKPIASNTEMLDRAAPATEATQDLKRMLITACSNAMAVVRQFRLGLGPLQAVVVGRLAELLPLKPSNKELAEAMLEPWSEAIDGPDVVTRTIHSDEYVDHRDENTRDEFTTPADKQGKAIHPKPYAQAARRYKFLAMIEANLPSEDWDTDTFTILRERGIMINSKTYTSPIDALASGVVSMEAVFQAYTNVLQPKLIDYKNWSASHVAEARRYAPKIKVVVRQFNKKMNREQKVSVAAVYSASVLYGLIMGLLDSPPDETKDPVFLGRDRADKIIAAVNARVDVKDLDPTTAA